MENNQTFSIGKEAFLLNGEPFTIVSGAIHYFRVPKEYWRDRLLKLKACGFNTVETYVAWNCHQKNEDTFDFSENNNIEEFLDIAADLGLYAIVRPGPYICGEWEFGGFPWWLLKYDDIELRCMNERYLGFVNKYFDELIPRIANHLITNGGNVIMVQVENEYGSYGDDEKYMQYIAASLISRGIDVPLYTADGIEDHMLVNGSVDGILKTVKFGANPSVNFPYLREFQEDGPLMCSEFTNGWFDQWGYKHYERKPQDAAKSLQRIMAKDASVSTYMFCGGTSFGWMNGANFDGEYNPVVNSYDFDGLLTESGDITKKYELFKKTIANHVKQTEETTIDPQVPKAKYGTIPFTHCAELFDNLDNLSSPFELLKPVPMEKLGQGYGYILYKAHLKGPRDYMPLVINQVHDRAYIFVNDDLYAIQTRNDDESVVSLKVPAEGLDLSILVENMGRVSFGQELKDYKGITDSVRLGQTFVYNWTAYPLPLDNLSAIDWKAESDMIMFDHPTFFKAQFIIEETPSDTFVKLPAFTKGMIWINGKPLSRYWNKGPQQSAYLPAPFLIQGVNEIVILETEGFKKEKKNPFVLLDNKPKIDG
ncbi:MAG: beta-galactosidase [Clostridiales bacterium]|nr:beta-galactosidase [Clostridiales bacterium]MCD7827023.1 beta-galactosidase [Clostridiales bacterium]